MIGRWNLPDQAGLPIDFSIEEVLVEYNGPQIVFAKINGNRHLSVAADEDEDTATVRWIASPISTTEIKALAIGVTFARDVLLKSEILVLDTDRDIRLARSWTCTPEDVLDENFPDIGAQLPEATRKMLASRFSLADSPVICIDRPRAATAAVPFRILADTCNVFQRLWTAIAQARSDGGPKERGRWTAALSERATLALVAAGAGSLELNVVPSDADLFANVANTFDEIVGAGEDSIRLAAIFERLGSRVRDRYDELLSGIVRHDLQMLMRHGGGAAFLASHTSGRVRSVLAQRPTSESRTTGSVGYFVAFDTQVRTFKFYDEADEAEFAGEVRQPVLDEYPTIEVGPDGSYAVFIETVTTSASGKTVDEKHFLKAIDSIRHRSG